MYIVLLVCLLYIFPQILTLHIRGLYRNELSRNIVDIVFELIIILRYPYLLYLLLKGFGNIVIFLYFHILTLGIYFFEIIFYNSDNYKARCAKGKNSEVSGVSLRIVLTLPWTSRNASKRISDALCERHET